MERKRKFTVLFVSIFIISSAIFSKLRDDLSSHYSFIVLGYLMLSFLIEDRKIKNFFIIASIILYVMIKILDIAFNYFKI